jgi:hypothetical protein
VALALFNLFFEPDNIFEEENDDESEPKIKIDKEKSS